MAGLSGPTPRKRARGRLNGKDCCAGPEVRSMRSAARQGFGSHVVTTEAKAGLQLPAPGYPSLVGGYHCWAVTGQLEEMM